jgi:hypothetical protein
MQTDNDIDRGFLILYAACGLSMIAAVVMVALSAL